MKIILTCILSVALISALAGADEVGSANILVVDREGQPVAGANMVLSGYKILDSPAIRKREGAQVLVQTDRAGRVEIKLGADGSCGLDDILSIGKEGYKFEDFLNPSWKSPVTSRHTPQNPRKYVLRKLEDEKTCMLRPVGVKDSSGMWLGEGFFYSCKEGAGRMRCDVDFFRNVSEAKPEWSHLRYTDFSIEPHFDSVLEQWSFTLTTTNFGCGIIATTNRVFRAPENGYGQRVEVSPELYTHPCFTLYFRTRTPRVYAMIPFSRNDFFGIKACAKHGSWAPSFEFSFIALVVNPTGGRTFEEDDTLEEAVAGGSVADTIRSDTWRDFLFEHRYPRPPDVPARIKNRKAKKALMKENRELQKKLRQLEKQIEEVKSRMNGGTKAQIAEATKELQAEKKRIDERLTSNGRECARLDKEVHTLFLEAK